MRQAFPYCQCFFLGCLWFFLAQIKELDFVRGHTFQYLLLAISTHNGAQRAVACNQLPPCFCKTIYVKRLRAFKLEISVSSNTAQLKGSASANPVRVLKISERKRLMDIFWTYLNSRKTIVVDGWSHNTHFS